MRYTILLVALAAMFSCTAIASADGGSNTPPAASAPAASAPATRAPARSYQRGSRRWGWFSGSAQNWNRSRGTPDDNSTVPTPVNRNPKGRPKNNPVIFPKNM